MPRIISIANIATTQAPTPQLLHAAGYAIVAAGDLAGAVTAYTACRPDGVLIEVDGMRLKPVPIVRSLQQLDRTARIALVLPGSADAVALPPEGQAATQLLLKPFDPTRWLRAVEALINPRTTRTYERVHTALSAHIALGTIHDEHLSCTLDDITPNGAKCRVSSTPMPTGFCAGAVVRLAIALPQAPIHAIARVVHITGVATVGVVFLRLSPAAHARLGAYYAALLRAQGQANLGSPADRRP
jgi:DNA-binding response OmpR family regulator